MSDRAQKSALPEIIQTLEGSRAAIENAVQSGILDASTLSKLDSRLAKVRAFQSERATPREAADG